MMAVQGEKKISIYDYPEHLNPFRENDHKMHFWNLTKMKSRRNSFSDGFKEFRRTWSFKSFTKKGRRESMSRDSASECGEVPESPIMYRSAPARASTMSRTSRTPEETNRYLYGGSVTPLPRFRFQERGSMSDQRQVDGNNLPLAPDTRRISAPGGPSPSHSNSVINGIKTENRGSLTSLQSNPFETSVGSIRSSARKKRRAPPPPTKINTIHDTPCITITDTSLKTIILEEKLKTEDDDIMNKEDVDVNHPSLNIELKIVEDIDENKDKLENNQKPAQPGVTSIVVIEEKVCVEESVTKSDVPEIVIETQIKMTEEKHCDVQEDNADNKTQNSANESLINEDETSQQSTEEKQIIETTINDDKADIVLIDKKINDKPESDKVDLKDEAENVDEVTAIKLQELENEVNYVVRQISAEEDTNDNFKKVDIENYKKQISVGVETKPEIIKTKSEENETIPESNETKSEENETIAERNETKFEENGTKLDRNETKSDENETKPEENGNSTEKINNETVHKNESENGHGHTNSNSDSECKVVIVKSGYVENPEKTDIIKENARRRSEFFELDKTIKEIENVEVRDKNNISENGNYQRRRVSDMKLLFDNPNLNDPLLVNPIPKPRRVRSTSKSGETSPVHNNVPIKS